MTWQDRAACREPGVDPEWFFTYDSDVEAIAKRICVGCPVRYDCLEFAKTSNRGHNERHGIWGGRQHERMVRSWDAVA